MSIEGWRERGAVSREEAAQILGGISLATLDELLDSPQGALLERRYLGRRVVITVHSLRRYLGEVEKVMAELAPPRSRIPEDASPRVRAALQRAFRRADGLR